MKKIFEDLLIFGEHLRLCPWSLTWSIPVLGLENVCSQELFLASDFFVSLALASSLVSSTPPLLFVMDYNFKKKACLFYGMPVVVDDADKKFEIKLYYQLEYLCCKKVLTSQGKSISNNLLHL